MQMMQTPRGLGFDLEAGAFFGPGITPCEKHFERHGAVQTLLPGFVDDAHGAAAQFPPDLIARHDRQLPSFTGRRLPGPGHDPTASRGPSVLPEGGMNFKKQFQAGSPLREAALIFLDRRRLPRALPQDNFVINQLQRPLDVRQELRVPLEPAFHPDPLARYAPPPRLPPPPPHPAPPSLAPYL